MCLPCDSGVSALVRRVIGNVQHCSDLEFLMERSTLTPEMWRRPTAACCIAGAARCDMNSSRCENRPCAAHCAACNFVVDLLEPP